MGKIVAIIPARAGSKSIPNKNIKLFHGKPLVYWTIEAALHCGFIEEVYVSTDGKQISDSVKKINHPKLSVIGRSPETATDTASTESVMLEFAQRVEFSTVVLIQATAPLLSTADLDIALKNYIDSSADSMLSVVRQKRFIWEDSAHGFIPLNYDIFHRPLRQDFQGYLIENGAFYVTSKEALLETKNRLSGTIIYHEMDAGSYIEIDEPNDWIIAEQLMKIRSPQKSVKSPRIKLFITDVDGVLTDNGMYYSENGDELKKFNTRDGVGLQLLRENGIQTAIFTAENTHLVANRAKKLRFDHLYQGTKDKLKQLHELCDKIEISLENVAFIGDDINDSDMLLNVGLSACPNDAVDQNRRIVDYICHAKGGEGCVREFAEFILNQSAN